MTKVIKRDCSEVDFDKSKISTAILKAMKNGSGIVKPKIADDIANEIEEECKDKEEVSISAGSCKQRETWNRHFLKNWNE